MSAGNRATEKLLAQVKLMKDMARNIEEEVIELVNEGHGQKEHGCNCYDCRYVRVRATVMAKFKEEDKRPPPTFERGDIVRKREAQLFDDPVGYVYSGGTMVSHVIWANDLDVLRIRVRAIVSQGGPLVTEKNATFNLNNRSLVFVENKKAWLEPPTSSEMTGYRLARTIRLNE